MPSRSASCSLQRDLLFSSTRCGGPLFDSFAASLAGAQDLQVVARRAKAKLLANAPRGFFNLRSEKLHGVAAPCAHHMMMRAAIQTVLVPLHAVLKVHLRGEPALREKLQCAVDRGVADARVGGADYAVQFLGAEVVAGG